ncbi:MAG: ACT domain-containing protein [Anaerolineae bacterium]|nr:ACT domain-containing protein [Anaerolineae bacterium]
MPHSLTLTPLPGQYAVCQAEIGEVPEWALGGDLFSVTRTPAELSIVCAEDDVPPGVKAERGWKALRLEGPFEFTLTGVLLAVLSPLADAGIGIFALSTYDTDYVLVKAEHLVMAVAALRGAGHRVAGSE